MSCLPQSGGSARPAAPVAGSSHGAPAPRTGQASESAARAGAAALARLGAQKDVNFSLSAIRAQALKELELEKQQQAQAAGKAEQMKPLVPHQHKEVPPQLAKDGSERLLFRCPMMGPQVGDGVMSVGNVLLNVAIYICVCISLYLVSAALCWQLVRVQEMTYYL